MTERKRYQLGRSPHLTVQRGEFGGDIVRSYETVLLTLSDRGDVIFSDTRIYSATTTRHQKLLADYFPQQYVLPAKRERVSYEYRLKQAGSNAWGRLYSPEYRVKDNPYSAWQEVYPGDAWDWSHAYDQLAEYATDKHGVTAFDERFTGTF